MQTCMRQTLRRLVIQATFTAAGWGAGQCWLKAETSVAACLEVLVRDHGTQHRDFTFFTVKQTGQGLRCSVQADYMLLLLAEQERAEAEQIWCKQ